MPHTVLHQTPCEETLPAKAFGGRIVQTIHSLRRLRLLAHIDDARRLRLHAERELVGADARLQFARSRPLRQVLLIESLQQVELTPLLVALHAARKLEVENGRTRRTEHGPLKSSGQ